MAIEPRSARIVRGLHHRRFFEVSARAERPAGPANDDDARFALLVKPPRGFNQFSQHRGVHRVQSFGTIERQPSERAIDFNVDCRKVHILNSLSYKSSTENLIRRRRIEKLFPAKARQTQSDSAQALFRVFYQQADWLLRTGQNSNG